MASREASLKVTLQPASFQAGLRRLQTMTSSAGKQMGAALKGPMVAGLKSAKSQVSSMLSTLKSGIGIAASLGGALSFGALAKDALQMQNTYRNIAFNVNKVAGNSESWESIQKLMNNTVQRTGKSADDLATSFQSVFEATGDLEFAKKSIQNIGETSVATGHSTEALANVMQLSYRKFGVGIDEADEAMVRFIEKTGVGGKGIEEMSSRFALMAGEAAGAGMKGTEGISQMLGMLLLLDSSIGEKADPGLKMMFQTIKGGSTQFLTMKKALGRGIKFEADMTAMEKIKALIQTGKGRKIAEQVFTADARVVYDQLAKPFDEAIKKAGGDVKNIARVTPAMMKKGLAAFDKNLADASASTMVYSQIQEEAAQRAKDDPMIKMNMALAKISDAFTKPEMIDAMNKLAEKMPAFADAVIWALNTFLDNPWETIAVVVGGKIAVAFAGSAITSAIATGMTGLFAQMAAMQAASTAASVATGGATKLGVGGAIAAAGAAGGAKAALAAAATTGAVIAGGAVIGGAAGYAGYKYMGGESGQQAEIQAGRRAGTAVSMAGSAAAGSDKEMMSAALAELSAAKQSLKENESILSTIIGGAVSMLTDVEAPSESRARNARNIANAEDKLWRAMQNLSTHTARAAATMSKVGDADASRGPLPPADSSPGASPKGTGG